MAVSYSWANILLGIGFAATTAYSVKSLIGPSIYRQWKKVRGIRNGGATEDNADSKTEDPAVVLAKAIQEQTEEMRKSIESLQDVLLRRSREEHLSLQDLRDELKIMADTLYVYVHQFIMIFLASHR